MTRTWLLSPFLGFYSLTLVLLSSRLSLVSEDDCEHLPGSVLIHIHEKEKLCFFGGFNQKLSLTGP